MRGVVGAEGSRWTRRRIETVCILHPVLIRTGQVISDHVWLDKGKMLRERRLTKGDILEFSAKVYSYGEEEVKFGLREVGKIKKKGRLPARG